MTDLRKAAEQALEALQYTCDYLPAKTGVERDVDDAITALRQALAQPDLARVGEVGVWGNYQALAQPVDAVNMTQERVDETAKGEHEPVAYVTDSGKSAYILLGVDLEDDTPLYVAPQNVAPQKREWDSEFLAGVEWAAKAIQAKLKEKNA